METGMDCSHGQIDGGPCYIMGLLYNMRIFCSWFIHFWPLYRLKSIQSFWML